MENQKNRERQAKYENNDIRRGTEWANRVKRLKDKNDKLEREKQDNKEIRDRRMDRIKNDDNSYSGNNNDNTNSSGYVKIKRVKHSISGEEIRNVLRAIKDENNVASLQRTDGRFQFTSPFLLSVLKRIIDLIGLGGQTFVGTLVGVNVANMSLWLHGRANRNMNWNIENSVKKWLLEVFLLIYCFSCMLYLLHAALILNTTTALFY